MRKIVFAALATLALVGAAHAQSYNNNQGLENWYRYQDQQERNAERMQEQQRWMQEQANEARRELNQRHFNGW